MTRLPTLKRFDVTVWKNKSTSDAAQVPATSTIDFYLQGATVSAAKVLLDQSTNPDPTPDEVSVYDIGSLKDSVSLQVNTDASKFIVVSWVDRLAGKVGLINLSGATITLAIGDRLVNKNDRPNIYSDPLGQVAVGTSIATSSATGGRAVGYVSEYRFDYIIEVTASDRRLYPDAEASFVMRS